MLSLRRLYTNGKDTSYFIPDLVGDTVKLQGLGFEGITLVPYDEALGLSGINELKDIMRDRPEGKFDEYKWLSAIENSIESKWDQTKFNLVFHSSGYDSRVISHFLTKVYRQSPGDILFVCIEPESPQFKEIMQYQGWDESQWTIYDRYTNPFNLMSDFRTAYEGLDGLTTFPVNMSTACIKYLQAEGKCPEDLSNVNLWTGIHTNELFKSNQSLDKAIHRLYWSKLAPLWGMPCPNIITPVTAIDSLKAIFSTSRAEYFILRDRMVRMLDPKLAEIDRIGSCSSYTISSIGAERIIRDFKNSYYYRCMEFLPMPEFRKRRYFVDNHKFWKVWAFASLVEHLVSKGVKIIR